MKQWTQNQVQEMALRELRHWRKHSAFLKHFMEGGRLRVHIVERSPTALWAEARVVRNTFKGVTTNSVKVYVWSSWMNAVWQHGFARIGEAFVLDATRLPDAPVWQAEVLYPWPTGIYQHRGFIAITGGQPRIFPTLEEALSAINHRNSVLESVAQDTSQE